MLSFGRDTYQSFFFKIRLTNHQVTICLMTTVTHGEILIDTWYEYLGWVWDQIKMWMADGPEMWTGNLSLPDIWFPSEFLIHSFVISFFLAQTCQF